MKQDQPSNRNFAIDESVIVVKIQCFKLDDLEKFVEYIKQKQNYKVLHISRTKISADTQQYFIYINFVRG